MDRIDSSTLRTMFVAAVGVLAIAGTWNRQQNAESSLHPSPAPSETAESAPDRPSARPDAEAGSLPAGSSSSAGTPSVRRRAARRDTAPRTPQSSRPVSSAVLSSPSSSAPPRGVASPSAPSVSSRRARAAPPLAASQQARSTPDPGAEDDRPQARPESIQHTPIRSPLRLLGPSGGQDGAANVMTVGSTGVRGGARLTPALEQEEEEAQDSEDEGEGYDDSDASHQSDDGVSLLPEDEGPPMVTLPALPPGSVGYVAREQSTHPWLARVRPYTDPLSGDAVAILALLVASYAACTLLCTLVMLSPLMSLAWERGLLGYLWAVLGPAVGLLVGLQLARGHGGSMPPSPDGPLLVPASQALASPYAVKGLGSGQGGAGVRHGEGQDASTPQGTGNGETEDPVSLHSRGSSAQQAFAGGSGRRGKALSQHVQQQAQGTGEEASAAGISDNLGSPQLARSTFLESSVARTLHLPRDDETGLGGVSSSTEDAQEGAIAEAGGSRACDVTEPSVQGTVSSSEATQVQQFVKTWGCIASYLDRLLSVTVPGPDTSTCPYAQAEEVVLQCLQALGYAHAGCKGFTQGLDEAEGSTPYATVKAPPVPTFHLPAAEHEANALLRARWDEAAFQRIGEQVAQQAGATSSSSPFLPAMRTGGESIGDIRRRAVSDLLWRKAQAGDIRGNAMLAVKLPGSDKAGTEILAAAGGDKSAAALSVFRRSLITVRHALTLHEPTQAAHKWAMILQSKCHGGDTKAKIAGGFQLKAHGERAVALNPSDPLAQHAMGVWCYEVAGLNWVTRRVATALFGEPPTATYEQAMAYFTTVDGLIKERTSEYPLLLFANRLKIAQCLLATGDEAQAKGWVALALNGPPVAAQLEEQRRVEVREMAGRLQVGIPPAWQ